MIRHDESWWFIMNHHHHNNHAPWWLDHDYSSWWIMWFTCDASCWFIMIHSWWGRVYPPPPQQEEPEFERTGRAPRRRSRFRGVPPPETLPYIPVTMFGRDEESSDMLATTATELQQQARRTKETSGFTMPERLIAIWQILWFTGFSSNNFHFVT